MMVYQMLSQGGMIKKVKEELGFMQQVLANTGNQYHAWWDTTVTTPAVAGETGKSLITQAAFLGINASSSGLPNEIHRGANF